MTATRLPAEDSTIQAVCSILLEPHVFPRLCPRWQTLFGLYELLRAINYGSIRVYASMDGDKLMGIVFGAADGDGGFDAHLAYHRHVDVAKEMLKLIPVMVADYKKMGLTVDHINGNVYADNRAIRLTLRRAGLEFVGTDVSPFRDNEGNPLEIYKYVLKFNDKDLEKWATQ